MANPSWLQPPELPALEGAEPLCGGTVLDFWRWALGDLRMNTARGLLVEYLVATAVGDPARRRIEWGSHDVTGADGTRIEVKASARLQSWSSRALSVPRWQFKAVDTAAIWSDEHVASLPIDPRTRVHVWVFALHTVTIPADYDPLDPNQWEFRAIPHVKLLETNQRSAGLSFFANAGVEAVRYNDLAAAILEARRRNDLLLESMA